MMSFSVVVVQYLVPCAIVTCCYFSICRYVGNPLPLSSTATQRRLQKRRKRSNRMLIVVTITHFMSWLPLNLANVIMTTFDSDKKPLFEDIENLFVLYAACHLASMTSAISNPLLYGFMNSNFRDQFRKIWKHIKTCTKINRNQRDNSTQLRSTLRMSRRTKQTENSEGLVTVQKESC